jgi:hypothetical protein
VHPKNKNDEDNTRLKESYIPVKIEETREKYNTQKDNKEDTVDLLQKENVKKEDISLQNENKYFKELRNIQKNDEYYKKNQESTKKYRENGESDDNISVKSVDSNTSQIKKINISNKKLSFF